MSEDFIIRAAQFAARAHHGVNRKYRQVPYITHPARVAGRVSIHHIATPVTVAVAWLHDVLEDVPTIRPEHIAKEFGRSVLEGVLALTNPSKSSDASRKERKTMDRQHIANVDHPWKVVKLIDRIDNLSDLWIDRELVKQSFLRLYAEESRLLLEEAFKNVDPELEAELDALIGQLESL